MQGDDALFIRPIYSGKAFEKVKVKDGVVFATIRPNPGVVCHWNCSPWAPIPSRPSPGADEQSDALPPVRSPGSWLQHFENLSSP